MLFQEHFIIVTYSLLSLNFQNEVEVKAVMLHHHFSLPLTYKREGIFKRLYIYLKSILASTLLQTQLLKYCTLKSKHLRFCTGWNMICAL